jgi:uroporphyrinogen decarboxylase
MNSIFLQAFQGSNKTVPVWFMRQAGRYLPSYRQIKEKYSLNEMFNNPELASEITCQPVAEIGVDAAILFADILTMPALMGINIHFDNTHGPQIDFKLELRALRAIESIGKLDQTIRLTKEMLPENIPLIGFAGSPFTVLCYLVEGGSSQNYNRTFAFAQTQPELFHHLMTLLTENTIRYLNHQREAGIDAYQIFDTWAGILPPMQYASWVLPYVQEIFDSVDLPSIYYVKNCAHLLPLMNQTDADFLSVCHTVVLGHNQLLEVSKKGIQGNLFNGALYADDARLSKIVADVLTGGVKHGRYIFNLSHGVFPDVDPEKLKRIVEQVHSFPLK